MTVKEMQNESGFVLVRKHGGNHGENCEGALVWKRVTSYAWEDLSGLSKREGIGH